MSNGQDNSYKESGVNIDEGNRFVSLIKKSVDSTNIRGVIGGIGGFAGLFSLKEFMSMKEPVLVSGTDGVGTKLKVAITAGKYDTVGIDLVAMSVNDLAVTGAIPLFFLDYVAIGRLLPERMCDVVAGISKGCVDAGCALLGGETAEMPGMYSGDDFDLAGFAVGIADKEKIIDGSRVSADDVLIGVRSSGFHSNGYSLLRNVLFNKLKMKPDDVFTDGMTVSEALLIPTKIYVKLARAVINSGADVKGMVHITGGGFYDNIPRVLPKNVSARIDVSQVVMPPAVARFAEISGVADHELYRVLNMGVGYIFVVPRSDASKVLDTVHSMGESAWVIGEAVEGDNTVTIKGIDF